MFCPHSVFVCFVWIWEQKVIISLYKINWLLSQPRFHRLKPMGYYMYQQINIQQFYVLPTEGICVLCGSQKKWLFSYTALTDWFSNPRLTL
jgi:hypothetical protein